MVRVSHFDAPAQDEQTWANHFVEQVAFLLAILFLPLTFSIISYLSGL